MILRTETTADGAQVRRLHLASFPGPQEADLVERLHRDGDAVIALVAAEEAEVAGHVMFSRMTGPFRTIGLGPVAVLPHRRRRGIADHLIREGLRRAGDDGWEGVFVLGDPAYYRRFGFTVAEAAGFESPYAGPYLMALALQADHLPSTSGRVDYAPAFAALG